MKTALFVAAAAVLAGCASNPRIEDLSSQQRAKLSSIQLLSEAPSQRFDVLGQVSGLSCHRNAYQAMDTSDREALEGIKLRAVKLNADAVINLVCQKSSGADWTNNCWASIKCIGDAIRFNDRPAAP